MKIVLTIILALVNSWVWAQDYHYKQYDPESGIGSMTFDITQDENGYIWMCGNRGLHRFNGYEFKRIPDEDIITFQLVPQWDGTLWALTMDKKLFYFHPDDGEIHWYKYNHLLEETPSRYLFNSMLLDSNRTLYLGFSYHAFMSIDSAGNLSEYFPAEPADSGAYVFNGIDPRLPNGYREFTISALHADTVQRMFDHLDWQMIPSESSVGMRSFRRNRDVFICTHKTIERKSDRGNWKINPRNRPLGIGPFGEKHLWVGLLNGGVQIYQEDGKLVKTLLPEKSVTDVLLDREKGLWIATLHSGVYYAKNVDIKHKVFPEINNGLLEQMVQVPGMGIHFSHYNGSIYRHDNGTLQLVESNPGLDQVLIGYHEHFGGLIRVRHPGNVILESGAGETTEISLPSVITRISEGDSKEELLLGSMHGFFVINQQLDTAQYETGVRVNDVYPTSNGYYCATRDGLMHCSKNGEIEELKEQNPMFSGNVRDIESNGTHYFIATLDHGVVVFNDDTVFNITSQSGLLTNTVYSLEVLNDSAIIVGAGIGLYRIIISDDLSFDVAALSAEQGMPSSVVNDFDVIGDSVWVMTYKGLCILPLSAFDSVNVPPKNLNLKRILLNDRQVDRNSLTGLSHDENQLIIEYEAINFRNADHTLYRYRLEGLEEQWHRTKSRMAIYPALPPGDYRFVLQASGNLRDFSINELSIPITINPPYYSTWWFRSSVALLLVMLVYLFFRIRILTYNRDIVRELLRHLLKRIRKEHKYLVIKDRGMDVKIPTSAIYYIRSAGNYVEVYTERNMYLFRCKIGEFLGLVPDPIEFLRVHRSYIIRLDKVEKSSSKVLMIKGEEIPISKAYRSEFLRISA